MSEEEIYYVYVYLDPRKPGRWEFKDHVFDYEPFYFGKGQGWRMSVHLSPANLRIFEPKSNKINKIIRETGKNPFYYKIEEQMPENEAYSLEREAIKHFGRLDLGTGILTNLTDGGAGQIRAYTKRPERPKSLCNIKSTSRKVIQKNQEGEIIKIWSTVIEAQKTLGFKSSTNIRKAIQKKGIAYGFRWELGGPSSTPKIKDKRPLKEIFQYSREGFFICSFPGVKPAVESLGLKLNSSQDAIRNCCLNKTFTACGYRWFYEYKGEKVDPIKKAPVRAQSVECFDKQGNFIARYESATIAVKLLGIAHVRLSCCKPFLQVTAGGFYWRYSK